MRSIRQALAPYKVRDVGPCWWHGCRSLGVMHSTGFRFCQVHENQVELRTWLMVVKAQFDPVI